MELKLSQKNLYFFFDETPSYAIKHTVLKDSPYRIIKLEKKDKLEYIVNEETANLDILIGGKLIDSTGTKHIQHVKDFVKNWNDSLDYINLNVYLQQKRDDYLDTTKLQKLKVKFFTWNLAGVDINLLDSNYLSFLEGNDLLFLAFQEFIPLTTSSSFKSSKSVDASIDLLISNLNEDYVTVQVNKLFGMVSILLCKKGLEINISNVEIHNMGTGFLNYGNKGSIMTKITLNDYVLYFLDCHLCTGETLQALKKRRNELYTINTKFQLSGKSNGSLVINDSEFFIDEEISKLDGFEIDSDEETETVETNSTGTSLRNDTTDTTVHSLNHGAFDSFQNEDPNRNIIFIGGDLNYRTTLPKEQVFEYLEKKEFSVLLEYDSLKQERLGSGIFQEFKEDEITFAPTYKFSLNPETTDSYDQERTPSYTDRILHSNSRYVKITKYDSVPEFCISDHKPVFADYELDVPLIDIAKRKAKIEEFYDYRSKKVNDKTFKNQLIIDKLENVKNVPILKKSIIKVKLKNVSKTNSLYFNILNSDNETTVLKQRLDIHDNIPFEIKPVKDIIPPNSEKIIKFVTTLPIGLTEYERISILRINDTKDFFITTKYIARNSYFGSTLFDITKHNNGGIPKPLYTLIDYLTTNFSDDILSNKHDAELEGDVTTYIDSDEEIPPETPAYVVANVLLLLLKNIDGGIVSSDLSTYLFDNKQDVELEDLLEQLPPLNVNILIYLTNFLRLCFDKGIPIESLLDRFQDSLINVPKTRRRDFLSSKLNYEKLRNNLLLKLIQQ